MIAHDTTAGYPDKVDEDDAYDDGDEEYADYDPEEEDDAYDDGDEEYADYDSEDGDEVEYENEDEVEVRKDETFVVLSVEGIQKRQYANVCSVCSVLSVSREVAILLLLHFNWNLNRTKEEWFTDEERIRKAIGFLTGPVVSESSTQESIRCRICFEDYDVDQMSAAGCGHLFCNICWNSYISISINDGPGCLSLRCPDTSCSAAIGEDMLKLVSKEKDEKKYKNYLMRSYVENNKNLKWCPAPGCDYAIEYVSGSDNFDVKCDCSYSFCWNCLEEIHRPVDCETVAKWNYKNTNEDSNMEWILANSKPCPKCKKPIEKNQGCMHMSCTAPCKHEFCWLCLGPWETHNLDYYTCNKYKEGKKEGKFTEQEKKRRAAKESIKRYTHFFQRWAANESSRKLSLLHLNELENEKLEQICGVQKVFITDIEYITKAWEQIIECRRVLKWAYAYGYYIPIEEKAKKQFFEFTQGEAEANLERLHQCAEEDVMKYANAESPSPDFINLREKLTRMTEVTRNYFDRLVRALENGLEDIESIIETLELDADSFEEGLEGWRCESCSLFNSLDNQECEACSRTRGFARLALEPGEMDDPLEPQPSEMDDHLEPDNRLEPQPGEMDDRLEFEPGEMDDHLEPNNRLEPQPGEMDDRLEFEPGEMDNHLEPDNRLEPHSCEIGDCLEPEPDEMDDRLEPTI